MYQKIKIYTEDTGNVENLTSKYFPGFTAIHCAGWYKGKKEHSVIIEIVAEFKERAIYVHDLRRLIHDILGINSQKSVLIEIDSHFHYFISTLRGFAPAWIQYIEASK